MNLNFLFFVLGTAGIAYFAFHFGSLLSILLAILMFVLLVFICLLGPAMFFEVLWDILQLLWTIVTWPFVMVWYLLVVAVMSVLVKLGLWHMPNHYDNRGHFKLPWN